MFERRQGLSNGGGRGTSLMPESGMVLLMNP